MKPSRRQNPFLRHCLTATVAFSMAAVSHADITIVSGHNEIDTAGNPALGVITRNAGGSASFNTAGTATAAGTALSNELIGPWATIDTGAGSRFATLDGGNNVTGYTAGTVNTWTNFNVATTNYETADNTATTYGGSTRTAHTIRYTGTGVTITLGNSGSGAGLVANGIMNAGSGTLTFNTTSAIATAGIKAGSTDAIVLDTAAANIAISARIHNQNNGATPANLVKTGGQTLTISSTGNTYSGTTFVNAGTLAVTGTGSIDSTSGIVINGGGAKYLRTTSTAGTKPITLTRGTLDGTGTAGPVTVADSTAAVLTHGNGTTTALTLGALTFNGEATVNVTKSTSTTPLAVTGALATTPANGVVTINASAALWNLGANDIISSTSWSGAPTDFAIGTLTGLGPRQAFGGIVKNGNNVAIQINGDTPVWSGALNGQWTTSTLASPKNWKLQTAATNTDFLAGDLVLFNDAATGTTSVQIDADDVQPASVTFQNSTKNYSLNSSGTFGITGATGLTKNGTGTLTLNNENYFTGTLAFNGGTLVINKDFALGDAFLGRPASLAISPGDPKTINSLTGPVVLAGNVPQSWNDDFTFTGSNNLDMGTGAVTLGGAGTDRTVTVSANTLTVGEIKSAAHGLVKQGAGTLVVGSDGAGAAASVLAGTLNVAAGTLQINRSGGASGDFTATSLAGTGTITNGAEIERWLMVNTANPVTFGGTLANGGTGGLGLNKQGAGTLTLTGANSNSGQTTLDGGTLVAAVPGALGGTSRVRFNTTNATIDFATDADDNIVPFTFGTGITANIVTNRATPGAGVNHTVTTVPNGFGIGGGTINFTSGANVTSGTGTVTITELGFGAGSVQTTTLNPTTASVIVGNVGKQQNPDLSQTLGLGGSSAGNIVSGVISPPTGTGQISVLKTGSSTWTLASTNTFTGGVTLGTGGAAAGVLRATASGALGTGTLVFDTFGNASDAQLALSGGITLPNTVTFTPRNVTVPSIVNEGGANTMSGDFTIATGGNQNRIRSDAGTLTISGGITTTATSGRNVYLMGAADGTISGVISNNGANAAGKINIIKEGTGTWTLSGANTGDGTTTVSAGLLRITGGSATSAVTVASGASLGGNGTIAGTVNAAGTIAPGPAAGTLTAGPVTLTGTLAVDYNGASQADKLVSTGTIDLTGSTLLLNDLGGGFAGPYVIAEGTGITGTFASVPAGFTVTIQSGGPGQQAVLSSGAPGGYAAWAAANAPGQTISQDHDGDGVDNGVEYFMGLSGSSFTANPAPSGGTVTWTMGAGYSGAYGTAYEVQTSTDLIGWTQVPQGGGANTVTVNPGTSVVYTLPTGGKRFVRLVVKN